jgi:hypothetical protein
LKERIASQEKVIENQDTFRLLCQLEKKIDQKKNIAGLI